MFESGFPSGATPLLQAAAYGDKAAIEKLLDQGVDIHEYDGELTTSLHYAVYNDEIEVVKLLLKEGANPNDSGNYSTALTASLTQISYSIDMLLLSFAADPKEIVPNRGSALSYIGVNTVDEFEVLLMEMYSQ